MSGKLLFAAQPPIVGVVEEPQCYRERKLERYVARIMFIKKGKEWEAVQPKYFRTPGEIVSTKWNAYFDGRIRGSVTLKLPSNAVPPAESWLFYRDWVLPVSEEVSRVSNSALFSGWCSAPAIRPMVITTIEKPSDPSAWKPFGVPVEYRERLLEPFRLAVGRVNLLNCNTSGGSEPQPFSVRVEDLRIFKGYASRSKEELISIGLDPSTYRYDGPAGTTWARHWFLLTDNVVDYVGNSMELVDSGDFDADGKSEVLFWHSEYNQDGYVLYFDDMRRRVDYTWSYH